MGMDPDAIERMVQGPGRLRRLSGKKPVAMSRKMMAKSSLPDRELALRFIGMDTMTFIRALTDMASKAEIGPRRIELPPTEMTPVMKEIARHYGADVVGTIEMQDHHYYSHHGDPMGDEYGRPVDRSLRYAIVFASEMDRDMVNRAPHFEESLATNKGYFDVALIGCRLALYLKSLGYRATLNSLVRYTAPLVPLARDAGLGQIGGHNLLITKRFGSRVRLGAVMTDMPFASDSPVDFGVFEFCQRCRRCVRNCPGKAISSREAEQAGGYPRWGLVDTKCMAIWNRVGTDCGVCLSSCPFSQEIEASLVERIKGDPSAIEHILDDYERRHGDRPYIKDRLPIAQLQSTFGR